MLGCCQYTHASKTHSSKCFEYMCPSGCIFLAHISYVKQGSIIQYSNLCILLLFSWIQQKKHYLLLVLNTSTKIYYLCRLPYISALPRLKNISEYRHPYGCIILLPYPNLIHSSLIPTHSLLIVHTQATSRMSN